MYLRNLFFLLNTIYLFSFSLYRKKEYSQCNFLILKIKKPLFVFDKDYAREKNKRIRVRNVKLLEKKDVLNTLKTNQKKCFNKNCRVDIKYTKGINHFNFFNYQSVVNNDFYQIDCSDMHLKRNKGKNLKRPLL